MVFLVLLDVLQLKVQHFLELFPHLIELLVLLVDAVDMVCFLLLDDLSQPSYFLVLLFSHLTHFIRYQILNCLFLMHSLLQLSDLELVGLLFLCELPPCDFVLLLNQCITLLFGFTDIIDSPVFSFLCFGLPSVDFLLKHPSLCGPIFAFALLFV